MFKIKHLISSFPFQVFWISSVAKAALAYLVHLIVVRLEKVVPVGHRTVLVSLGTVCNREKEKVC